ncbi:MAG: GIY-YIG nuclease family protein [bacterium]|nr:GIY-YIG nuclease family protein [bacterium]
MAYVYILQSLVNGRYYIGSTSNLERRLTEHNLGKSKYTSFTRPFVLKFSQKFSSPTEARKVELWLKRQKDAKLTRSIIKEGKIQKEF